jgi:hypothetical protein
VSNKPVGKFIIGTLYFFVLLLPMLLILFVLIFGVIRDIRGVRISGFAGPENSEVVFGCIAFIIGISLIVPAFRLAYYKLPWLFPTVKILLVDAAILIVGYLAINYGYQVRDPERHAIFFMLSIIAIVVGTLLMCIWFNKKKVEYVGDSK